MSLSLFRNPPSPPFAKGGLGGFLEGSAIPQDSLFDSGYAGSGYSGEELGMEKRLVEEIDFC